ncbi:fasciclin domain-containing protein [Dyadobacter sediminis]|uniref:Fasciclin domain-containing protein n=1 Tax=Dyadobacter sediminis TaxID=1493691 RepID=A0A5R9K8R4_9BACT|nr:fasciclin domain-containing protein [Dyadobacter sediminis]TLU90464.1 fasciclin domain-containing protein [Dyadobacter sediminis]GGC07966.1 hypothetical protein GCM10011325_38600 [Dyadobacter sediminis]
MKKNHCIERYLTFFLIAVLFSGALFSCTEDDDDRIKPKTLTDVILENEQFSILRDVMLYAEMSDALRTDELTVFAPNNNSFGKAGIFSSDAVTRLPKDSVRSFLRSHIIPKQRLSFSQLTPGSQVSLNRNTLSITRMDSTLSVNKSDIIIRNVNAANGIIHVIDSVVVRY